MSTEDTIEALEAEHSESADPKASSAPSSNSADNSVSSASSQTSTGQDPAKPKFDIDKAIKDDLIWSKRRREEETRIKNERDALEAEKKSLEPLKPMLEHLSKVDAARVTKAVAALASGDKKAAVAAMVDLDDDLVLALADIAAESQAKTEVPVEEQIRRAMEAKEAKEREERERAEAEAKAKGDQEYDAQLDTYVNEMAKALRTQTFAEQFPLCAAFIDQIDVDKLKGELREINDAVGKGTKTREDLMFSRVLKPYEDRFFAAIQKTPFGPKAPAQTRTFEDEENDFYAQLPRDEGEATPVATPPVQRPVVRTGGVIPPAPQPGSAGAVAEIDEELDRMEKAWRSQRQF